MKLGPVPKHDYKRNTTTSKKINDDVMPVNCGFIVFFPIYGQFKAIRKPDSRRMVYKNYIFIKSNLPETENRTKKSLTRLLYY